CTPRTHEPLFQETLREAGLNKHLFEMANIRDQCSWVHFNQPQEANVKAKDLVRMAVARAATLRPFGDLRLEVDQRAIVLGAGLAGMTAALSLAQQGFEVALIEREPEPGGIARRIRRTLHGEDPQAYLDDLVEQVKGHPRVKLYTSATIEDFSGHMGKFKATLGLGGRLIEIGGGAVIVATGGEPYVPTEYSYPESDSIITQLELEAKLDEPGFPESLREVVMIQCVGSRDEEHPYCSRVCCQNAVKNALAIKGANPEARVYVLYRDMRTYGLDEIYYERAREAGVVFIRFEADDKPQVSHEGGLRVTVTDDVLQRPVGFKPDLLVLSAALRPHPSSGEVSQALKVPLNADGFFLEAHMKLRPLDFPSDGIFLAGAAHAPKTMAESISQAKGAAARAATVISKPYLDRSGVVSEVNTDDCAGCLTCVRTCPYGVPEIGEDGVAHIEPASCQGCGVCASVCPRKAITTRHYRDDQIISKVDVLFGFFAKIPSSRPPAPPPPANREKTIERREPRRTV
ncbi:MAG: FAD-dependent oxidoreductase, partial [Planctomycetota bacterium]